MTVVIRASRSGDEPRVSDLYRAVAATPGGLARLQNEVSLDYVQHFLQRAWRDGLSLVAELDTTVVGEIHAYAPGIFCFSHVWSDLTIAVSGSHQGMGVGRKLFETFMAQAADNANITRVELIARESNARAIAFYETLGFRQEGRFEGRIRNLDGSFEADIPMAWTQAVVAAS